MAVRPANTPKQAPLRVIRRERPRLLRRQRGLKLR